MSSWKMISPTEAPSPIHCLMVWICLSLSGSPSAGMRSSWSAGRLMSSTSWLCSGLPGLMTSPSWARSTMLVTLSNRRLPFCLSAPWHWKQLFFRMGQTSSAKLIFPLPLLSPSAARVSTLAPSSRPIAANAHSSFFMAGFPRFWVVIIGLVWNLSLSSDKPRPATLIVRPPRPGKQGAGPAGGACLDFNILLCRLL